ncbi:hypothetical protein GF389_05625 [Candidatus Dojkabacteria bacterium]|nr:hypothetical protein [Candidatus Dojkabacteria bacterium]
MMFEEFLGSWNWNKVETEIDFHAFIERIGGNHRVVRENTTLPYWEWGEGGSVVEFGGFLETGTSFFIRPDMTFVTMIETKRDGTPSGKMYFVKADVPDMSLPNSNELFVQIDLLATVTRKYSVLME